MGLKFNGLLSKKFQGGFSLIELMVVVGIIGILAAVAIPQFTKFQARARQSEAKTTLGSIATAEKGFVTEWSTYTIDLKNAGVILESAQLRYDAGFVTGAGAVASCGTGSTAYTSIAPNAPTESSTNAQLSGFITANGSKFVAQPSGNPGTAVGSCNNNAFTAVAWGDPTNAPTATGSVGNYDEWSIDNLSNLKIQKVGY